MRWLNFLSAWLLLYQRLHALIQCAHEVFVRYRPGDMDYNIYGFKMRSD